MRKTILIGTIIVIATWFSSCGINPSASLIIEEYNDSTAIIPSPNNLPVPEGMALGIIKSRIGNNKLERNLLSQLASYNSALIYGDIQSCINYVNKDAVVYFRKYNPEYTNDEIMYEFFKTVSNDLASAKKQYYEAGIDFEIVIKNLVRKVEYKDNIFIVLNITSNLYTDKLYSHLIESEEILAISQNKGKNWSFITINSDTPNILRISNSNNVIDAIMGY